MNIPVIYEGIEGSLVLNMTKIKKNKYTILQRFSTYLI